MKPILLLVSPQSALRWSPPWCCLTRASGFYISCKLVVKSRGSLRSNFFQGGVVGLLYGRWCVVLLGDTVPVCLSFAMLTAMCKSIDAQELQSDNIQIPIWFPSVFYLQLFSKNKFFIIWLPWDRNHIRKQKRLIFPPFIYWFKCWAGSLAPSPGGYGAFVSRCWKWLTAPKGPCGCGAPGTHMLLLGVQTGKTLWKHVLWHLLRPA